MTPRGRRLALRALALALAALVLLAGAAVAYVSWRSADELVHPERSLPATTPADAGLAYERVTFDSADGIPLVGWWMPAGADAAGTVVFLHGYGDGKHQSLRLAPALHDAGYHVLAFDFRAHGESGGAHTTVGLDETRDVAGALAWLAQQPGADAERVALVGFSMGAAAALNAAASLPEVDALVSDSGFATLENVASNSITHFTGLPKYPFGPLSVLFAGWMVGRDVAENAPARAAASLDVPVLVVQGEADTIAFPEDDGAAIFRAAPAGSLLWLVPGASHVGAVEAEPAEYATRVVAFLDEHLR